jgi:hypothetical protein
MVIFARRGGIFLSPPQIRPKLYQINNEERKQGFPFFPAHDPVVRMLANILFRIRPAT